MRNTFLFKHNLPPLIAIHSGYQVNEIYQIRVTLTPLTFLLWASVSF